MKALFYFPINTDLSPDSGIVKKNKHILSSAKKLGVETDVITFSNAGIHLNGSLFKKVPNIKIARAVNNYALAYSSTAKKLDFKKYDFVWIRAGFMLPPLFLFIKRIKKDNPNVKIILEYGAYPFKNELTGHQKALFPISEHFSQYLKDYVSNVITYCGQDEIYGMPNIKIGNGVDVNLITYSERIKPLNSSLHLISVSSLLPWHACDRVIKGIEEYYQNSDRENKIDVFLHIVGDAANSKEFKRTVENSNIADKVVFHGFKIKSELDEIFDKCHLAIGTLGMHRINLHAASSLKNREYFARGMPFFLSTDDADFPEKLPFVKYVPSDDSAIDIDSVIEFYKSILNKYPNYPGLIRKYAEENLTWESKIKQVLKAVQEK